MTQQIKDLRARYNAGGNAVIPNTFQHPNIFIDKLMFYLTPVENVTLTFAVRRILGFQSNIMSRKDNISLSQFTDGITAEDGTALCLGTGIGNDATIKALEALCHFNILLPTTEKADPKRGQEYWLQDNENNIDWIGLENRKNEKVEKYRQQTQKARYSVEQRASVEQTPKGDVEQTTNPLLNRDTKPTETHRNPQTTTTPSLNVFKLYESNIGPLTPIIADALKDAETTFTAEWVALAITAAAEANVRKMSYINAVLAGYKERGSPDIPRDKTKPKQGVKPSNFDNNMKILQSFAEKG